MFAEIDDSGDGVVNWEEFTALLQDHRVLTWLAALDLDVAHCEGLFELLDTGDGRISFHEFVQGVQRLKGPAKSVDLVSLGHQLMHIIKKVEGLTDMIDKNVKHLSDRLEG